MRSVNKKVMNL